MNRRKMQMVAITVLVPFLAVNAQVISGSVKDALNGQPITGAIVTVTEVSNACTTDINGKYMSDTLAKGSYSVRAEGVGYLKQSKTVMLAGQKQVGSDHVTADFTLFSLKTNADASKGVMSVKYFFPGHADVEITITDSLGKVVRKVFDRSRTGGSREFSWDGKNSDGKALQAGQYTCKITSRNLVSLRTLTLQNEKPQKSAAPAVQQPASSPAPATVETLVPAQKDTMQ